MSTCTPCGRRTDTEPDIRRAPPCVCPASVGVHAIVDAITGAGGSALVIPATGEVWELDAAALTRVLDALHGDLGGPFQAPEEDDPCGLLYGEDEPVDNEDTGSTIEDEIDADRQIDERYERSL